MKEITNTIDVASLFGGERGQVDALQLTSRPSCPKTRALSTPERKATRR
jgi:hypothetical protein